MSPKFQELNLPISLKFLANTAVFLPLFGFGFCLIWSFWFDYETSTQTHCEVDNFAPSISAAIGNYLPQKYVWQTCISLHITPRFLFLYLYKQFYETRLSNPTGNQTLIYFTLSVHFLELVSLLGLSIVSSLENFDIHKICFGTFVVCSLIYFALTIRLWTGKWKGVYDHSFNGLKDFNNIDKKSLETKRLVLKSYFVCGMLCTFFYWEHNTYCYPNIYSFFCVFEYVIVLANMYFHWTAYYDFENFNVTIPSGSKNYLPLHNSS